MVLDPNFLALVGDLTVNPGSLGYHRKLSGDVRSFPCQTKTVLNRYSHRRVGCSRLPDIHIHHPPSAKQDASQHFHSTVLLSHRPLFCLLVDVHFRIRLHSHHNLRRSIYGRQISLCLPASLQISANYNRDCRHLGSIFHDQYAGHLWKFHQGGQVRCCVPESLFPEVYRGVIFPGQVPSSGGDHGMYAHPDDSFSQETRGDPGNEESAAGSSTSRSPT